MVVAVWREKKDKTLPFKGRVLTGARCPVTSEDLRRAETDTQRRIGVTAGTTQEDLDGQRGSGMDQLRCD